MQKYRIRTFILVTFTAMLLCLACQINAQAAPPIPINPPHSSPPINITPPQTSPPMILNAPDIEEQLGNSPLRPSGWRKILQNWGLMNIDTSDIVADAETLSKINKAFNINVINVDSSWIEKNYPKKSDTEWKGNEREWSEREIQLMNSILKDLPDMYKEAIKNYDIIRSDDLIAPDGVHPGGVHSSAGSIIIDGSAYEHYGFSNATTNFSSVFVHELTHALQKYDKQLLIDYKKYYATHKDEDGKVHVWMEKADHSYEKWDGSAITGYARTAPWEHMAESAKFYVFDPDKLRKKDPLAYQFLKDHVFNGKEY